MKSPTVKAKKEANPPNNQEKECVPCKPLTSGNPLLDKAFQVFLKKSNIKK